MDGEAILEQECLVLSPCALEGVISDKNADKLKCKYIVEGANAARCDRYHGYLS